ncbi:amidase [Georgenia satyanarayanai]|uniref:Amidase n=1 Tax=Georgenia satyanarayanai TaxID=860221 RepID=A0A2Y9ANU5_9MICO|nr:amidase [Georgenia satyanarayanai]PYF98384.1 amidase [Georgenia satyanarayanai]SSA45008.1 amidase [Georgenia satyanarayanai]
MSDIHELSALDLAAAVRSGEIAPDAVVEHTLERAERLGPAVGAFAHLTPGLAREQAAAATRRLRDGGELPPFLGVPVPVKDLAMVAGQPFEAGSAALRGYVAPADDGVAIRLREAGTLMVGKTTTPELGLPSYTEPDVAPPARSPWDPRRSAGGSSGGAAAAVAAGIVPAAHASDGGGSIRIPAAACGLVGLKASRGRVSKGPLGVDGAGLTVDGVVTRTVRDTAAFLDVLAEPWPGDHYLLPGPRSSFLAACGQPPRGLRIGVLTRPINVHEAPVHETSLAAVDRAVRLLEEMGHAVTTAQVPFSPEEWDHFNPLWAVGALSAPVPPEAEELLVPLTRWMREQGRQYSGVDYAAAVAAVQRLARSAAEVWRDLDVVLTPALATPAPFIGAMRDDADPAADFEAQKSFTPWTSPWNMLGAPAITVPLHRAEVDGVVLPVGVQLGATRLGDEELLLGLAAALEEADPWPTSPVEPA